MRTRGPLSGIASGSWWDIGLILALAVIAVLGFETSYGGLNFLAAGLGGLAVGALAAIAAAVLRLSALPAVLLGVTAYFLFGSPLAMPEQAIAGVLPSADTLAGLVLGAVFGWGDVITLQTPVQAPYYMTALPYFASWVVAFVGVLLCLTWIAHKRTLPRSLVVLALPTLLYLAGIMIGTDEAYFAAIRGVGFGVLALVWLGRRQVRAEQLALGGERSRLRGRVLGAGAVVAGAAVLGAAAGVAVAPPPDHRFVLREEVTPPFDPTIYPSPLAGYRHYTKDLAETPLFTVTGLRSGQYVRLAAMDQYTGMLWTVSGTRSAGGSSGSFGLVGRELPEPALATVTDTEELSFSIEGYDDVWLPLVGYTIDLEFEDASSRDRRDDLRFASSTGVGVLTSGVREGTSYTVVAGQQAVPDDSELARVRTAQVDLPPVDDVPDIVAEKAQEFAGEAQSPIEALRSIETQLIGQGVLSHGRESDVAPSRAGHGADRIQQLLSGPMVGDEEQFAATMALMARSLGYPARVVLGFAPEVPEGSGSVTVVGDDVTAWVEVPFEDVGWIEFHPVPTQQDVPTVRDPQPQLQPRPQVRQPPRQLDDDDELLTEVTIDDSDDEDDREDDWIPAWVWIAGSVVLTLAALIVLPMLLVAAAKGRRRARRRRAVPHRSAAGAWSELADSFAELGYVVPRGSRVQTARVLEGQAVERAALAAPVEPVRPLGLEPFARRVDADVFGGADVSREQSEERWNEALIAIAEATRRAGRAARVISRYRIRSTRSTSRPAQPATTAMARADAGSGA